MLAPTTIDLVATAGSFHAVQPPQLDRMMLFGFLASFATLVCLTQQREHRAFRLSLAICLAAMAVYGFLQGAWALGLVVGVWSLATARRWRRQRQMFLGTFRAWQSDVAQQANAWANDSRVSRMFGRN